LIRRTSINSISEIHKEKEMADFRRWFYALAVVALLAGFTVPVRAQAPTFQCIANAGVPPIVRGEGYTELVGDLTLNCSGGIPTPAGQAVPPVNFTVLLNTNVTSKLLAGNLYDEALLIIDEPHSAVQPARPILNCGAAGAPDVGGSGPGVCSIISNGNPALTYDGTPNITNATACTGTYGCGRPNVFQGRTGTQQNPNQFNSVTWLGVPIDPPGTTTTRTIRMTNIRADAVFLGVSSTFTTNYVQAQIAVNGQTSISINNPQQIVAYVNRGLIAAVGTTTFGFLQCNAQNATGANSAFATGGSTGTAPAQSGGLKVPTYTFTEGFASSWKTKNISFVTNTAGNGVIQTGNSYWTYNQTTTNYPVDLNQNVPGAIYNTESGFEYPSVTPLLDPAPNPPNGVGTVPVTATTAALSNAYNGTNGTAISGAGIATQGTRLALQLSSIPNGSIVLVPTKILLTNSDTVFTAGVPVGPFSGVAVLTSTDANGAGAFVAPTAGVSTTTLVAVPSTGLIVYEILFADPFSVETATIPIEVAYAANLAQNLAQPGVTSQVAGSFAPFYSTQAAHNPSSTLPVPRFVPGLVPVNLFSISKCACDILFPYVVSAAGYDTGIAIANTSFDPGATFGFGATPQQGSVEFWYYGTGANNAAPPGTQCTNTTSPGTCPGTTVVPAGQVLTYVASTGSAQWGLDNRAAGFVGYVIAQSQFQYCHAFAFIGALGAGPTAQQISEGYLGLILDYGGLIRTSQLSENLVH
jgi:hypothetical protein